MTLTKRQIARIKKKKTEKHHVKHEWFFLSI
jgi:hypothetical protein